VAQGERGSFNLFCIPGWKRELGNSPGGDKLLANYDASLSFSYLSRAGRGAVQRRDILNTLQSSPGPFLLTCGPENSMIAKSRRDRDRPRPIGRR